MASDAKNDARLNFRLPSELKQTIQQAAAHLGQSVNDFAVSTLVETARRVIEQHHVTRLSNRDRDLFISLMDDASAEPNLALVAAAEEYNEQRA
ncbi:MAG TPA: DUF1778 domain-containing protein [Thermoguttaceae bacterium]|nr:DUF1778 domain-containing protein [Thermoguttaceae bacterium]